MLIVELQQIKGNDWLSVPMAERWKAISKVYSGMGTSPTADDFLTAGGNSIVVNEKNRVAAPSCGKGMRRSCGRDSVDRRRNCSR